MPERPDYKKAKQAAEEILREYAGLEPPVNPIRIAREMGVEVRSAQFSPEFNSISGFYDAGKDAIIVNESEYSLRKYFTIAHELGHKVLHADWAKSNDYKILLRGDFFATTDPKEKEANTFAANLLVPRFMLDKYWKAATVEQLSKIFVVSVQVIKHRIAFEYGA